MKKALLIVDYMYDFVADDGKLTCGKPAQDIQNYIASLVEEFASNGDFIAVIRDDHEENDIYSKERNMFPLHCYNNSGRALYGKVQGAVEKVDTGSLIYIDKNRYSSFFGTPLDLKLKERCVSQVHIVGVATDICVLHTAVDAYNLGYEITVHKNGVASFDLSAHNQALNHFKNVLGAEIV